MPSWISRQQEEITPNQTVEEIDEWAMATAKTTTMTRREDPVRFLSSQEIEK